MPEAVPLKVQVLSMNICQYARPAYASLHIELSNLSKFLSSCALRDSAAAAGTSG
jgi:hypothetical protein